VTTQDEKIRTAIHETAAEIPPDHGPPLRLPPRPSRRQGTLWRRGPQRWPAWMAPLAAAITVTAVIAGAFALSRQIFDARVPAHQGTGPVAGWAGTVTAGAGPPAYYVLLGPVRHGSAGGPLPQATITGTLTGKRIATVPAPRPYVGFDYVAAAGNSSTFVLAARQQDQRRAGHPGVVQKPEKFFLLQVSPSGHARLTPLALPVKVSPGFLAGIALSPDGSKLALASEGKPPWTHGSVLQVVNLANGTSRRWTWPDAGSEWDWSSDQANLAWMNEQALAFQMPVGTRPAGSPELGRAVLQTRVLDTTTTTTGASLAASRRVPGRTTLGGGDTDMTVATGAGLIMEFDRTRKAPAHRGIDEVSITTGRTVRILGGGTAIEAFWSNATGTKVIVLAEDAAGHRQLGIVTAGGTFTALPAPRAVTVDWQYLFTAW
jgi:hypothetical protein